jgi:tRNA A37 methylthiotransferase MiaB
MTRKYLIETFGCQMNVHDSERMAGLLDEAGYEPTTDESQADVIVINTCSVREHAEEKLYTRLGQLRVLGEETGQRRIVAVAGCVAQQEGTSLRGRANGRHRRHRRHAAGADAAGARRARRSGLGPRGGARRLGRRLVPAGHHTARETPCGRT